ncbi:hypothetical protein EV359DRAFT_46300 [Lentinula novae-zelandiae]|nr:hypothetical protein EV359DRAFT_46300 [Lentinula novae-zelandiae]
MFNLVHDPNDLDLLGIVISHLEHADDIALISRSAHGLQSHLRGFELYCHSNNLTISAGKSWVMVFGCLPSLLPILLLGGEALSFRDSVRYVGAHLQSTHRHLLAAHYTVKRDSAFTAAGGIAGCDLLIGHQRLDPPIAKQLYSALVDCHLINGCEIAIDTDAHLLSMLEQVQLLFLRRMLGLSRRSILAPLFTETGIMPIRTRRVILALRYLIYLLKLGPEHYAHLALQENFNLRNSGMKCWLSDVDWAIRHLPSSTLSLPPSALLSEMSLLLLINSISKESDTYLQSQVDSSHRLALLHGRREPQKEGPSKYFARTLRHYLIHIRNHSHRRSLTRLLCGDMVPLTFRSSPARIDPLLPSEVPAKQCRSCQSPFHPESPQHIFLQCAADHTIVGLRTAFLDDISPSFPLPRNRLFSNSEALHYLKHFIFNISSTSRTARFIHEAAVHWTSLHPPLPPAEQNEDLTASGSVGGHTT